MRKKTHGKSAIVSSIMARIIGGMVVFGMAFVVIKRIYAKKKEDKVPHTRLIVEKVPHVLTLKLLKDASTRGQVYKGWLSDGTVASIRCLNTNKKWAVQSYMRQLELVAKLRHMNSVSAIGHCFECSRDDSNVNKILVLKYVPNGTLRSFISEDKAGRKFSWTQWLTDVIGIAKGIQFLHTGKVPIISNDLKITDVLLDHDYHVKISKFNLPLLAETIMEVNIGSSSISDLQLSLDPTTHGKPSNPKSLTQLSKQILWKQSKNRLPYPPLHRTLTLHQNLNKKHHLLSPMLPLHLHV